MCRELRVISIFLWAKMEILNDNRKIIYTSSYDPYVTGNNLFFFGIPVSERAHREA